ncbi:Calcium-transporting ATPase 1 [Methanimicrococcus hongohii]|uniref:P-type Ca(2+) transporter n=1 Tax=Methanimicrococcus hongohii TaxID=3028295 RepID=A0AA96UY96_9EURY|nr:calcium-translocating P-type ATPase, PMCA-type [Methanimicrococcus sp. Hf6]WNY22827.1 Calcium-transporting ATPase 1 [Methanimicrococcus sp. Hf6]
MNEEKTVADWCSVTSDETCRILQTNPQGLSNEEAERRLKENGPNKLEEKGKKSVISIFLSQFKDLMIWVLIAAALITAYVSHMEGELPIDTIIISIVVILNAALGTAQEYKAEASLEALKKMAAPNARVLRNGAVKMIPAADLVVGDIVVLEAGDSIPADIRITEANSLKIEESALTGESRAVDKSTDSIQSADGKKISLGDRENMAFMGTNIVYGRGSGVVIATGMNTEIGKIAGKLSETKKEITPLQKKLNQISKYISILVIIIAVAVFAIGYFTGQDTMQMFLTAVSLAVAAIPEGMVAAVTIVLALGMSRMAKKGALVRRLPAVETLGSTQVICSDKTGTLTQNKMTVKKMWVFKEIEDPNSEELIPLTEAFAECNDSRIDENGKPAGDPTENAFLDYVLENGLKTTEELKNRKRAAEIPFESDRKRSTVAVAKDDEIRNSGIENSAAGAGSNSYRIYVKGAAESIVYRSVSAFKDGKIVPMTDDMRKIILTANEEMAEKALRVLAFAYKDVDSVSDVDFEHMEEVENDLIFCGMSGMIDPARPEVKETIQVCRKAGIIPVMITGDHKTTAVAIANDLGLLDDDRIAIMGADLEEMDDAEFDEKITQIGVYARVSPEHKVRIVDAWQKRGKIVAMTGDGVNDAPALKSADIGVGMGITGTDVAKGTADMVLTDDNFATIVIAVKEGRGIFDNIHKTVSFLLSSNIGEVIAILAATVMGFTLLSPIHILWVNLVTDTFPALALGVEPPEEDIMERQPRDQKIPFLTGSQWFNIFLIGLVGAILTLTAYFIGSRTSAQTGITMAFMTLGLIQLFAALGFQSERQSIFKIHPKQHPYLWLAFFGSAALQVVIVFVPFLRDIFGLTALTITEWALILVLCFVMLLFIEFRKAIFRYMHNKKHEAQTV